MAKGKWIQGAIKHKGALRATAKRHGALKNGIKSHGLRRQLKVRVLVKQQHVEQD